MVQSFHNIAAAAAVDREFFHVEYPMTLPKFPQTLSTFFSEHHRQPWAALGYIAYENHYVVLLNQKHVAYESLVFKAKHVFDKSIWST